MLNVLSTTSSYDRVHIGSTQIRTEPISFCTSGFCSRGRRNHSEDVIFTHVVEEVDVQLGFEGEIPTPKSLGERSIRVRVRDSAQKMLVPTITVGIPIVSVLFFKE